MADTRHIDDIARPAARKRDSHKGSYGRVLVIAGSRGMTGAAALCGESALKSGAGLVKVACPQSCVDVVAGMFACYTTAGLADSGGVLSRNAVSQILQLAGENDVVAMGPGITTSDGARSCVEALLKRDIRLVLDADGLNCLAILKTAILPIRAKLVITPHPGEFARLWKSFSRKPMPENRTDQAVELAKLLGCTVVLKGAQSVVCNPDSVVYVNDTGNPGMATGGTGDVLTGVIAALMGQGMSDFDAAAFGVYIHGLAGDIAAGEMGEISMTARDLLDHLPAAFVRAL